MSLEDWDEIDVRWRAFRNDGRRIRGYIVAKANIPRAVFTQPGQPMVVANERKFPIVNGVATLKLRATDDPDISITGFTYTITEYMDNVRGSSYDISVPLASKEDGVEIADVIILGANPDPGGVSDRYAVTQEQLKAHINSPAPHPVYDDIPSLTVIFENRLV